MQQPKPNRQVLCLAETKDYIALEYIGQNEERKAVMGAPNVLNDERRPHPLIHLLPLKKETPDIIDFNSSIETSLSDPRFIKLVSYKNYGAYDGTYTVRNIAGLLCISETVIVDTFVQCFTNQDDAFIVLVGSPEFIRSRTVGFEQCTDLSIIVNYSLLLPGWG